MSDLNTPYTLRGHEFHYRYAAIRVLRLLDPSTELESVSIEGARDEVDGEDVCDFVEYYKHGFARVIQTKHSTRASLEPVTISTYGGSINDFARIYFNQPEKSFEFVIVTNRPIGDGVEESVRKVAGGLDIVSRTFSTLLGYCREAKSDATNTDVAAFCKRLKFEGLQHDLEDLYKDLYPLLERSFPRVTDVGHNDVLINAVRMAAQKCTREERQITLTSLLATFGVSSLGHLFPAMPVVERCENFIDCVNCRSLLAQIDADTTPFIIHANAGVGKTAVMQELVDVVPAASRAVFFDCFGGGEYRSSDKLRHRTGTAFTQIINTLARQGLCQFVIPDRSGELTAEYWVRFFVAAAKKAIANLRKQDGAAKLYLFVDAADNAKDASAERGDGDDCFVDQLLKMSSIEGLVIVLSARTARYDSIESVHSLRYYGLPNFNKEQVLRLIARKVPSVTPDLAGIVCDFTEGNPRTVLHLISDVDSLDGLSSAIRGLAPVTGKDGRISVEQLLDTRRIRVEREIVKECTRETQKSFEALYQAIATLPPPIPFSILAKVIDGSVPFVADFVNKFDYPFWVGHNALRFRDEPTETWFRSRYGGDGDMKTLGKVVDSLKLHGNGELYAVKHLPWMLFRLGRFDELEAYVLDESTLPVEMSEDIRKQLQLKRLTYAIRVLLQRRHFARAYQIALRAGALCGDSDTVDAGIRQHICLFISCQRPEDLVSRADSMNLRGAFWGSEYLYKAVLLSAVPEWRAEALQALADAREWIEYADKERKRQRDNPGACNEGGQRWDIDFEDIVSLALAILNLQGVADCVAFLRRIQDQNCQDAIAQGLSRQLKEGNKVEMLRALLVSGTSLPSLALPIVSLFYRRGEELEQTTVAALLAHLVSGMDEAVVLCARRLPERQYDYIVDFCMVAVRAGFSQSEILCALDRCYLNRVVFNPYRDEERQNDELFRGAALALELGSKSDLVEDMIGRMKVHYPNLTSVAILEARRRISEGLALAHESVKRELGCPPTREGWRQAQGKLIAAEDDLLRKAALSSGLDEENSRQYVRSFMAGARAWDGISYWRVLQALARRAVSPATDGPLVFRFMKAGEWTRHNADRDKYFDRFAYFSALGQYAPSTAIALFSRWRDRLVGDFDRDMPYFIESLVRNGVVDPSVANCFTTQAYGDLPQDHRKEGDHSYKTPAEESTEKFYRAQDLTRACEIIRNWRWDGSAAQDILSRIEYMPEDWRTKYAVRESWKDLLDGLSDAFVSDGFSYTTQCWFKLLAEADPSGELKRKFYQRSGTCEDWSSVDFFQMVIEGVDLISQAEAASILDSGLKRIESEMPELFGDGDYNALYLPNEPVLTGLAALVCALLGSPSSRDRWCGSHVVVNAFATSARDFLRAIWGKVQDGKVVGYVDRRLPVYADTARVHLLLSVNRAAVESADTVREFFSEDLKFWHGASDHYLIRTLSQEALAKVGISREVRPLVSQHLPQQDVQLPAFPDGFVERFVGLIGRAFAMETKDVERSIRIRAVASFGPNCSVLLSDDPRLELRNLFQYAQEFEIVEGARPKRSSFWEDCCYHAMMRVVDGLTRSRPVLDPDAWEEWRRLNGLARTDGLWISDIVERVADADARFWIEKQIDDPAFFPLQTPGRLIVEGVVRARDFTSGWYCSVRSGLRNAKGWTQKFGADRMAKRFGLDNQDRAAGGVEYLRVALKDDMCRELSLSESYFSSCDELSPTDPRPRVFGRLRTVDLNQLCEVLRRREEELLICLEYGVLKSKEEVDVQEIFIKVAPDAYIVARSEDEEQSYPISTFKVSGTEG